MISPSGAAEDSGTEAVAPRGLNIVM